MDTRRYMISDAAKMVDVEAHVLRYWEEELELPVERNEMVIAVIQKRTSAYSIRSRR